MSGSTTSPKSSGTVPGVEPVPKVSPERTTHEQASGSIVSRTGQWIVEVRHDASGTNAAIGNTTDAAKSPLNAPATTFSMATSETGSGASTRSSISLV